MSKVMENCHFPTGLGGTGDNFAQFLGHTLLLKLMLDKSFSPEEYQDVKFQLVPIASAGGDDILLATTIDGAIHALNKKTGIISWSFTDKTKPLISGNFPVASTETFDKQAWYLNSSPNFLVEPLYPGGLYTYVPGGTLQKMPASIKSLVSQSPVRWPDGTMFLGKKTSEFYVFNKQTGELAVKFMDNQAHESSFAELKTIWEGQKDFLILVRTDYSLTAYRIDAPPQKLAFSEYSGIRNPKALWHHQVGVRNGEFSNSMPQIHFDAVHTTRPLEDIVVYSSLTGLIYARDRKSGTLIWTQNLQHPVISILRQASEENGLEIYSPTAFIRSIDFVHVPIESIPSGECPDERGEISHPTEIPIAIRDKFQEDASHEFSDLVNVGSHEGVLFILPHSKYPRFRSPVKVMDGSRALENRETALIQRPSLFSSGWDHTCTPSHHEWPYCLTHMPQFFYEQTPIKMLNAGPAHSSKWTFTSNFIWSALIGMILALSGFIGKKLWTLKKLRNANSSYHQRLETFSSLDTTSSSTRSRPPPGFEEISIATAEISYHQNQENYGDSNASLPRSFTVTDQIIGYGSHGTVVFKGIFDGRDVAVKRMLIDFYDVAGHEVTLLQQSDNHPNVIRYFCREQTDRFMYIVLELCPASLADLIERQDLPEVKELLAKHLDKRKILQEIMLGLEHLHSIKLVHRDLKPANILISSSNRILISDFGLSKKLADDQSSFHATVQSGTIGWRAPECILSDEISRMKDSSGLPKGIKITKAIDIFASGCIFYYVLTDGRHPFGTRMQREINIVQNKSDLSGLDDNPTAKDLIERMTCRDPLKRPNATQILNHPYFWESGKRLNFLLDVSDHLEREHRHTHPTNKALEQLRSVIYGGNSNWSSVVDSIVWEDLSKFRKYFGNSVQDLLRAMRNKRHHFQELSSDLKSLLGESTEAYLGYFERHFPHLLIQVYLVIDKSPFRAVHPFKDVYFADFIQ